MYTSYRTESDSLGNVNVPENALYGAQTARALDNFAIGNQKLPIEFIRNYALLKGATAKANFELGSLSEEKTKAISQATEEIYLGKFDEEFPLKIWQSGSGTQTNMNLNEVIANRAIQIIGGNIGSKTPIHPNDDVNMSQSTNDTFPTVMHITASKEINYKLLPVIDNLKIALREKVENFKDIVKIGRTHLMDATPLTLGQEFSGYLNQVEKGTERILNCLDSLNELPIGGTAVGTGINTKPGFDMLVVDELSKKTGLEFRTSLNKFEPIASHDTFVELSGSLKTLAVSLFKMANDLRWLASGPRAGFAEIILPSNEPGSSIMPGKVNPTQIEVLTMICTQVIGNDTAITFAGAGGNFELNVYKPLIIYNILEQINLLSDGIESFTQKCLIGIKANEPQIKHNLENSLMLVTNLNSKIGYDKSAKLAKLAFEENLSLREANRRLAYLSEEEFEEAIDPRKMV
jgi:fumarate hydratase class II